MLTYAIASKQNSSPIKIKERERKKKHEGNVTDIL